MSSYPQFIARIGLLSLVWSTVGCGQPNPNNEPSDLGRPSDTREPDVGEDVVDARPAARLKVATFNVGRLFDTVCDSNNCGDSNDFERQYSPPEFDFKIGQIGGALEELDADIVALEEVENQACLDALVAERPEYDFAVLGEIGGSASLDVAVIGRGLIHLETRKHRADTQLMLIDGRTKSFARELLEVHFELQGKRVVVFAAHFKAQRNDDPEWRLGEATVAREIAEATQAEFPAAFVYLSGDLNDEPGTPPLDAITGSGGLVSVTEGLPKEDIWTYGFINTRIAIDHILYVPAEAAELVAGTAEVVRDASGAFGGSDHAALRAEFNVFTD